MATHNHPLLKTYGGMVQDLYEHIFPTPAQVKTGVEATLKILQSQGKKSNFGKYERAWILKLVCRDIQKHFKKFNVRSDPSDTIDLNLEPSPQDRLKRFRDYLRRLRIEDQLLLLLKDRFKMSDQEISCALEVPEESLHVRRQQSLRALEEWIWDHP